MDYEDVSETPGIRVTPEAASMLYTRYAFASSFCANKEVLEVGCAAGMGLGFLAKRAKRVTGGDYSQKMLSRVPRNCRSRASLIRLDAHALPFKNASFDVIVFFEGIYYLSRPAEFMRECRRVLRDDGTLLLCSVNCEWKGFSPSALSHGYLSAKQLRELLQQNQMEPKIFAGYRTSATSIPDKIVSHIRNLAVRLNLFPQTMRGKEILKRIFYGRLVSLGSEITDDMAEYQAPTAIPADGTRVSDFKVLYAVGHARAPLN